MTNNTTMRDDQTERRFTMSLEDWDDWGEAANIALPTVYKPRQPWMRATLNREAEKILKRDKKTSESDN